MGGGDPPQRLLLLEDPPVAAAGHLMLAPPVRDAIQEDAESPARFADFLDRLAEADPERADLWHVLKAKDEEQRASFYARSMEMWLRSQGWNMAKWLLWLAVPAAICFVLLGGEVAFESALLFLCGAASYYVVVQVLTHLRARRNERELAAIRGRYRDAVEQILQRRLKEPTCEPPRRTP
jgi:hypothetical protein